MAVQFFAILFILALTVCESYGALGVVTETEFTEAQKSQLDEFDRNGTRGIIRDYSDAVVLIYSISNKAKDDGLIFNSAVKPRLKKHYYKTGVTSGVLISSDGLVCTTYSGVMNADSFIVSVNSEHRSFSNDSKIALTSRDYKAEVVKLIPELDLAFLKIKRKNKMPFHCVKLGNDAALINKDDRILMNSSVVIGKARGEHFTNEIVPANSKNNFSMFAAGVEKLQYQNEDGTPVLNIMNFITNPAVIAETDGGAILNTDGELIGIAKFKSGSILDLRTMGIPVSVIKKGLSIAFPGILKMFNKHSLGISVKPSENSKVPRGLLRKLKIPETSKKIGVVVKSVDLKSIADNAGILPGDVILLFNSEPVASEKTFKNLEKASIGTQTIALKILRGINLLDIELFR